MNEHQTDGLEDRRFGGPWLVEARGEQGVRQAVLGPGERLTIGCGHEVSFQLADPTVSRVHAELVSSPEGVSVEDCDSRNGVRIGEARLKRALLGHRGGSLLIGRTTVTVRPHVERAEHEAAAIAGLVGSSRAMQQVRSAVRRFASVSACVLIQGESGVGKDVVARAIHGLSGRSGPYLPINIGGLSAALADAELFGHTRGAFTGAIASRKGAFETAQRGTLFLDEIADLAPEVQVKLLRVLEEKMVRPLGASQSFKVDVRVLAASWANLEEQVADEVFRQDLYHRIATVSLVVPPLRERLGDIPELVEHLLQLLAPEVGAFDVEPQVFERLADYDWPGNVRELRSVLYRAALSASGRLISVNCVEQALPRRPAQKLGALDVQKLLEQHDGNVSRAARAARVPRSTFRDRLRRHRGLEEPQVPGPQVSTG